MDFNDHAGVSTFTSLSPSPSTGNLPVITGNLNEATIGVKRAPIRPRPVITQESANVDDTLVAAHKTADTISPCSIIVTEIVKTQIDFSAGRKSSSTESSSLAVGWRRAA